MSYQVFARKYRPKTFDDLLGQEHVVRTLKNAIQQDRLAHAYLFVGPRGTGKTSTARIFAKALNGPGGPKVDFDPEDPICRQIAEGQSLDVTEIDGASNNSVDDIRGICENINFQPAQGKFRIYYIDEVHMLSIPAFNALLKTLEEPPEHVKFIFATTEAHKILPTILSRCQRFDLRPISEEIIASQLLNIAEKENLELSAAAAKVIARGADGGMRDALSMLDQLVAFCGKSIQENQVLDIFGLTSRETIAQLMAHLLDNDAAGMLEVLANQADRGRDLQQFLVEFIRFAREILISKLTQDSSNIEFPPNWQEALESRLELVSSSKLLYMMDVLAETEASMRWAIHKRIHLELGMIKALHSLNEVQLSDVIRALDGAPIENKEISVAPRREVAPLPKVQEEKPVERVEEEKLEPLPILEQETEVEEVIPSVEEEKIEEIPEIPFSEKIEISSEAEIPNLPEVLEIELPKQEPLFDAQNEKTLNFSEQKIDIPEEETLLSFDGADLFSADGLAEPESNGQAFELEGLPDCSNQDLSADLFSEMDWQEFMEDLAKRNPLFWEYVKSTRFLDYQKGQLTLGLPKNDVMARDYLLNGSISDEIKEFVSKIAQSPVIIRVEMREDIEPVEDLVFIEEEPESVEVATPEEVKSEQSPAAAEPNQEDQNQLQALEDLFYQDPLIEDALKILNGRLIR